MADENLPAMIVTRMMEKPVSQTYTIAEKINFVKEYLEECSSAKVSQERFSKNHNLKSSTFNDWVKDYRLGKFDQVTEEQLTKRNKKVDISYPEIEKDLIEFVAAQQGNEGSLTWLDLQHHATIIAEKHLGPEDLSRFRPSPIWIQNVLKKGNIIFALPPDTEYSTKRKRDSSNVPTPLKSSIDENDPINMSMDSKFELVPYTTEDLDHSLLVFMSHAKSPKCTPSLKEAIYRLTYEIDYIKKRKEYALDPIQITSKAEV
eukprot:gene12662-26671_t